MYVYDLSPYQVYLPESDGLLVTTMRPKLTEEFRTIAELFYILPEYFFKKVLYFLGLLSVMTHCFGT
jgi:hypothetical protein